MAHVAQCAKASLGAGFVLPPRYITSLIVKDFQIMCSIYRFSYKEKYDIVYANMFKEMLFKKMLKAQMKGVPESEQEKILKIVTKNPELFKKIAVEMQEKIKSGKDQMAAAMEVMESHREELSKLT